MSVLTLLAARGLSDQFAGILGGLRRAIGATAVRSPHIALLHLVWRKMGRVMARFDRLAERAARGDTPPPRQPGPPASSSPAPASSSPGAASSSPGVTRGPTRDERAKRVRFPEGFAWLCRHLPGEAASFGSQLRHMLAIPEMAALIEADPQVGRLLRPLLRMLGTEPGVEYQALLATPDPPPRRTPRATPPAAAAPAPPRPAALRPRSRAVPWRRNVASA